MGWLNRQPKSRIPADMKRRMELLGLFELDPQESDIESGTIYPNCLEPFLAERDDRDGFLAELRDFVERDTEGLASYGASRLVMDLYSGYDTPDAVAILDAAVRFKIERGLPAPLHYNSYELSRYDIVRSSLHR